MAIVFDNAVGAAASFASSITQALTVGSNANRGLFVASFANATTTAPTTATYNGVGMTADAAAVCTGFGKGAGYVLAAPASGANNVVVNFDNANAIVIMIAMSYDTDVDQATPSSTGNGAAATSAAPSVTVTSATGDVVVAALYAATAFGSWTAGAGTNERIVTNGHRIGADEAGAASTTVDWSGVSDAWMLVATNLKKAAAPGGVTPRRKLLLGVGI